MTKRQRRYLECPICRKIESFKLFKSEWDRGNFYCGRCWLINCKRTAMKRISRIAAFFKSLINYDYYNIIKYNFNKRR